MDTENELTSLRTNVPLAFAVSPLDDIKKTVHENFLLCAHVEPRKSKHFAWSGPCHIWSYIMLSFIKAQDVGSLKQVCSAIYYYCWSQAIFMSAFVIDGEVER